jgi:hypothetical protein
MRQLTRKKGKILQEATRLANDRKSVRNGQKKFDA